MLVQGILVEMETSFPQTGIWASVEFGRQGSHGIEFWDPGWIVMTGSVHGPVSGRTAGFPLRIVSLPSCTPYALGNTRHTRPRKMLKILPFPQRGFRDSNEWLPDFYSYSAMDKLLLLFFFTINEKPDFIEL